jgi:hypothetical protein
MGGTSASFHACLESGQSSWPSQLCVRSGYTLRTPSDLIRLPSGRPAGQGASRNEASLVVTSQIHEMCALFIRLYRFFPIDWFTLEPSVGIPAPLLHGFLTLCSDRHPMGGRVRLRRHDFLSVVLQVPSHAEGQRLAVGADSITESAHQRRWV